MNKLDIKKFLKAILFPVGIFCVCLGLLMIMFSLNGFALFSHQGNTIISFDMQSEYIAYLRYFKRMLLKDGQLDAYSFSKDFGGDFLSIYTFYLASPFNYLVVFVKDIDLPLFFLWTSIIKMSLGGSFMYLLVKYKTNKDSLAFWGFGIAYGLVSYSFIYLSNYMWIDGVMVLPLVILGLEKLKYRQNPVIYIFALAYGFITGWYIGTFIAIFSVLFFIARFIAHKGNLKERLFYLLRFSIFSFIGGMIACSNWLVAFSHFSGTKATNALPAFKTLSFSMFFSGALENGYISHSNITINAGYMPLFISIAVIALAVMFFFNKGYDLKTRLSYLGILVFYYVVSLFNTTNALMHGGREPTWFPARYAFVISFLICYLGALEINKREETPLWGILSPIGLMAVVIPIVLLIPNEQYKTTQKTYQLSVISLVIYLSAILLMLLDYLLKNKKVNFKYQDVVLTTGIMFLTILSAYRGGNNVVKTNTSEMLYQKYETYLQDLKYDDIFDGEEEEFHRTETLFNRPGNYNQINNNPLFYGFNGLSHFSSNSKKDVGNYMAKLGFLYNGFFTKYSGGSTVAINSLLGVKYVYDDKDVNKVNKNTFINHYPYQSENIRDNIVRYENVDALSLTFTSNKTNDYYIGEGERPLGHETTYWYDDFEYQNQIFKTLSGRDENIFSPLEIISVEPGSSLTWTEDEYGIRRYTTESENTSILVKFRYNGLINDHINFYVGEKSLSKTRFYIDNNYVGENSYWNRGIRGISIVDNAVHTLRMYISEPLNEKPIRIELYSEDIDVLEKHLNDISIGHPAFKVTKNYHSYGLKAEVNLTKEDKDLIFTIPFEKGIHIYVDGKEVKAYKKLNIFTAIDLNKIETGKHEIEVIYEDRVYLGASIVSCLFIGGAIFYCTYFYLKKDIKCLIKKKEN